MSFTLEIVGIILIKDKASWVHGKARGLAIAVFLMFVYYIVIYFLDLYKEWNSLFGSVETTKKAKKTETEEYGKHRDSQDAGFGDSNYDQDSMECNYRPYIFINSEDISIFLSFNDI